MRCETLQESQTQVLDLTLAQAQALERVGRSLASRKVWWGADEGDSLDGRSVVRCTPDASGKWKVVVANAVGVIAVGDLQLVIEPKIPTEHLLYLFAKSGHFPRLDSSTAQIAGASHLWELVATWLVHATEQLLRGDLRRDYQDTSDDLDTIRGRLDPRQAAMSVYQGRLSFACQFDEFTVDSPLNRVLRAAARMIAGSPLLAWGTRRRGRALVDRMDEVGDLAAGDLNATLDRRTAHYATSFALARHVLGSYGRLFEHGAASGTTFLIPTPDLAEAGLRRVLQDGQTSWHVDKRGLQLQGSNLKFTADLVFGHGQAIGDIKYKLSDGHWNRGDLYQALAFATAYDTQHAAVIGFRPCNTAPLPPITVGRTELTGLDWPADSDLDPTTAATTLVAEVAAWLARLSRDPSITHPP